jgi:leucyl aminopeptidase
MIDIQISQKKLWDSSVEGHVFFFRDELTAVTDKAQIKKIKESSYPNLEEILEKHRFAGKKGQVFVLTAPKNKKLIQYLFVGLGKVNPVATAEIETLRRVLSSVIQISKKLMIKEIALSLPSEEDYDLSSAELIKQVVIACHMADYEFTTFKSKSTSEWGGTVFIESDAKNTKTVKEAIQEGTAIGKATHMARTWADTPGNIMTPTALSEEAKKIAKAHKLKCTIFGKEKAEDLKMGCFLGVDSGSDQDGKFVILEYQATKKNVPTIALVGKGITFDTGGINLKPSSGMEGMKYDMSGAAAVISVMGVIAQLKPNVNVIGVTPIVENMPSGKALRQDDIIRCMNGKTVEIKSTDAEGRLILSDALCYTEKFYKPEIIIDIATLTGACSHALGHFYSAMLTRDEDLAEQLFEIGKSTGDRVWRLPLDDDYKEANKSDFADIANCGSPVYLAGTITAACFLECFVKSARWVHLDIAGVANKIPGINYLSKGATGAGVRLLVEFVMQQSKK